MPDRSQWSPYDTLQPDPRFWGAFGDPIQVSLTADIAQYASRAADTRQWAQSTVSGGGIAVSNGEAVLSSGVNVGASATLRSVNRVRYQPGFSNVIRFAGRFPTGGVAGSSQYMGAFHEEDGLFIGYSGTSFGVFHRYLRKQEIQTLTITAAATGAGNVTVTLGGTGHTVAVTNAGGVAAKTASEIAAGGPFADAASSYSAWQIGSTVVFVRAQIGAPPSNTYTLNGGATGAAGTFAQTQAGTNGTQSFAALGQTTGAFLALDALDGNGPSQITIDPTKANVYAVTYGWLGYAGAVFWIKDPSFDRFWPVTRLQWAGTAQGTSVFISDPHLSVGASVESTSSSTNLQIGMGSALGAVAGEIVAGPEWARDATIASFGSSEVPLLSLANAPTLTNTVNRRSMFVLSFTISNYGAKEATFRVRKGAALTGPQWVRSDSASIVLADTAATAVSGGNLVKGVSLAAGGSITFVLNLSIRLNAQETLTITGQTTAATSSALVVINGYEDP